MKEQIRNEVLLKEVLYKDTSGKKTPKKNISFGTVTCTNIVNPFDPIGSKKTRTDIHGSKLSSYLEGFCLGQEYVVFVNKKETEDYDYIIKPNDNITYIPLVQGGSGGAKSIVRLVAIAIVTWYAPTLGAKLAATYGGVASAWAVGLTIAGSLLVNAILPPSSPQISGTTPPELESKSYSWNGIETNRNLNVPIPVLYGTHNLGGTVINNQFYYQGSNDWIGTQLALCQGEIYDISPNDITINKAKYSSFIPEGSDDEGYFKNTDGAFDQPIMTGFDEISYNNQAPSQKVEEGSPYTFTTVSNNINNFKIHFECPNGLFTMSPTGDLSTKTIEFLVEYRPASGGSWTQILGERREYLTEYQYNIIQSNINEPNYGEVIGTGWTTSRDTWIGLVNQYTGVTRQVWSGNYVNNLDNSGDNVLVMQGNTRNSVKTFFEPNDTNTEEKTLQSDRYEIRVTRLTPEDSDTDNFNQSNFYVRFVEEINTAKINYGGVALIGFNLKATQQISGSRPNYSIKTTRKNLVIQGNEVRSNNPAWACYDYLSNPHYGGSIPETNIEYSEFEKWAKFCDNTIPYETYPLDLSTKDNKIINNQLGILITDETYTPVEGGTSFRTFPTEAFNISLSNIIVNNMTENYSETDILGFDTITQPDGTYLLIKTPYRFSEVTSVTGSLHFSTDNFRNQDQLSFNGVLDTSTSLWQGVQDIAVAGRGQIILQGNKYSVIYDSIKNVSGLYNASNSKDVSISYTSQEDVATEVELQFSDANLDYEMNQVSIQDSKAVLQGVKPKKTTIQVKGITTEKEALRHARYLLATSKFIRRTATFTADIESLTQTIGDLVALQTDVTEYGSGGLIEDVQGNVVTLEQPISLTSGTEYTVKVKEITNDNITDYTFIASTTEDTNQITLPNTSNIHYLDRYSFGEKNSDSFIGTITDISRDGDLSREVTIAEYNESILNFDYDDDMLQRTTAVTTPQNSLSGFRASDRLVKTSSGEVIPVITFNWNSVLESSYTLQVKKRGEIFYQRDQYETLSTTLYGNTFDLSAQDLGRDERTYIIVDNNNPKARTELTFEVTAFDKIPDEVTNVFSNSDNGEVNISWSPNTELDFKKYLVQAKGKTYESTIPKVIIPENKVGSYDATIQVQDTSGNLSPIVTHNVTVTEASLRYSIEDNQLLEKAFRDGVMTIFVGDGSDKTGAINYDIWKVQLANLTVAEFTYASEQLDGLAFDDLNSSTFKYFQDGEWFLCTKSQLLVIQRMLGYATTNALADGNVRVFNKQPFPPYSVGDIWIDGNLVRYCDTEKLE